MKWRALLALGAALLLVLPLTLVVFFRSWAPEEVEGWRLLPRLQPDELEALPSWGRPCGSSAECEVPLACFRDERSWARTCTASMCVSDRQCPVEWTCRSIPVEEARADGTREAVRLCAPVGQREEGEPCVRLPEFQRRRWTCERGLVCAGSGWCGRRCEPGRTGSCPGGFFCARGDPEGPTCLPTCEGRACPEGTQCVRLKEGVSSCATVHGGNCQRVPCPAGHECEVFSPLVRPGEVWMQCLRTCGGDMRCPPGHHCDGGSCRPVCYSDHPDPCEPDERCLEYNDEGYGVCVFDPDERRADAEGAGEGE